MDKEQIISEIRRTAKANGGIGLGRKRFEEETGINYYDWYGVYWASWSDALREAGFAPNQMQGAHDKNHLLESFAQLALELGRIPGRGELGLKRRRDSEFPSWSTFARLGTKAEMVNKLLVFCLSHQGFDSVAGQCEDYLHSSASAQDADTSPSGEVLIGYVYLLKHGSRREYKIGRTNNPLRREGEIGIELPEKVHPVHVIKTDDPAGIESYWHSRFADKRKEGEWFALTVEDVRAFKRWKRIC